MMSLLIVVEASCCQVSTFKVNTEDVFKRWSKTSADLKEEIQTLQIQREEVTMSRSVCKLSVILCFCSRTLRPFSTSSK